MESRRQNVFWWEGNVVCCFANLFYYDSVLNRALKQVWLAGFKEATSRNIIDYCFLEVDENVNMVANDVLMDYVGHESCSKDDEGAIMVTLTTASVTSA
jgi:hypothetical protein